MIALLPILFAFCQSGPDLSASVTYSSRAARASIVVSGLARASGLDLQTDPAISDEVLVIAVKDRPLKEVMDRIAAVTAGEWVSDGSAEILRPSESARAAYDFENLTRRSKAIRAALIRWKAGEPDRRSETLQAIKDRDAGLREDDSDRNRMYWAHSHLQNALAQLEDDQELTRLLMLLPLSSLGNLTDNRRLVYSDHPTAAQRCLSPAALATLAPFVRRHNAAARKDARREARVQEYADDRNEIGRFSKVILVVKSLRGANTFENPELRFLARDGSPGRVIYGHQFDAFSIPPEPPKIGGRAIPIGFSADSKSLRKAVDFGNYGNFAAPIGAALEEKLKSPDRYDPLSFCPSDAVLSYAEAKGRPLVADLPDSWGDNIVMESFATVNMVEDVGSELRSQWTVEQVPDRSFVAIRPAVTYKWREGRLNRVALASLIARVKLEGVPRLDELAEFAAASQQPANGFMQQYLDWFVPGVVGEPAYWDMLGLYASLGEGVCSNLRAGKRLAIRSMTAGQRAILRRMIFDCDLPLLSSSSKYDTAIDMRPDPDFEPTEVLPQGLPDNGTVEVHVSQEPFVLATHAVDLGGHQTRTLGPAEMALYQARTKTYPAFGHPPAGSLRIGMRTNYRFVFRLGPKLFAVQTLQDHKLDPKIAPFDEKHIPASFRASMDRSIERFRKGRDAYLFKKDSS